MIELEVWNDKFGYGFLRAEKDYIGFLYEDAMINGLINVRKECDDVYSISSKERAYFIPLISANILKITRITADGRHIVRFINEHWQKVIDGENNESNFDDADFDDYDFDDDDTDDYE